MCTEGLGFGVQGSGFGDNPSGTLRGGGDPFGPGLTSEGWSIVPRVPGLLFVEKPAPLPPPPGTAALAAQ